MQIEYDIRPVRADETERVLDLVRISLGDGANPRDRAYWNWKHVQSPFGESPCLVAEARGQIVALRTFMRWRWRSNGDDIHAARAVDTATHPNWRHKGIFAALTRRLVDDMRREGVQFIFNTPNAKSRAGYLKMGWQSLGRPMIWIRPLRPFRLSTQKHLNALPNADAEHSSRAYPARYVLSDPGLDDHLREIPGRCELAAPQTQTYLRWRYADVPGFEYFANWRLSGSDTAIVVHRVKMRRRTIECRICELIAGTTTAAIANGRRVIREALRTSSGHFATAMARFDTAEAKILAACGFVPVPYAGPVITVRPLRVHSGIPDPTRRSSWRLSIGALELF